MSEEYNSIRKLASRSDDDALTHLSTTIHQFRDLGFYNIIVFSNGAPQQTIPLRVTLDSLQPAITCDLLTYYPDGLEVGYDGKDRGYVQFSAVAKDGTYEVEVWLPDEPVPKFKSKLLTTDDMFASCLMRPGTYELINDVSRTVTDRVSITVPYPSGASKLVVPEVIRLKLQGGQFKADGSDRKVAKLSMAPTRGLLVTVKDPIGRPRVIFDKPSRPPRE